MIAVRSDGSRFGREVLSLWSGPFASQWEGSAFELPRHDGYVVTLYDGRQVRVSCQSPRTDESYAAVDDAIRAAIAEPPID